MPDLEDLIVRNIMVPAPATVAPATSVAEAARIMATRNIGAVTIATAGCIEGIFTERDMLRYAPEIHGAWNDMPVSRFMTRNPVTIDVDAPWANAMDQMDRLQIRHLPVLEAGKLVGMLSVRDILHHRAKYLTALVEARTAELAARNTALTQRDDEITLHLSMAGRIQRRMLPERLPDFAPFRFAVWARPQEQVTGDYYDFMPLGPDRLTMLIADVSGHGVPAAFVSVMAKTCFNAYCAGIGSPAGVLETMNYRLSDLIDAEKFVTMFVATVDRTRSELRYASAGHPLPLVCRAANRDVIALDSAGTMIGLAPNAFFEERSIALAPGDKVLFYTDGVTECRDDAGAILGMDRLVEFLRRESARPVNELVTALEAALVRFRGNAKFDDDVTVLGMEMTETATH